MDSLIPSEMQVQPPTWPSAQGRAAQLAAIDPHAPMTALSGGVRYGVLRLTSAEIVVDSLAQPPMRGTVDLICSGERVARLLVQFSWERDGRAGYELKRIALAATAAAVPHGARGMQEPDTGVETL